MERAERFVLLGIALAFPVLVPMLWLMLALTAFTAVQRFVHVYRLAGRPPQPTAVRPRGVERPPTPLRSWWMARRLEGQREGQRPRSRPRSERRGAGRSAFVAERRGQLTTLAYRGAARVAQAVPARFVPALGRAAGRVGEWPQQGNRRMSARHQRRVTGTTDPAAVHAVFEWYGRYWLEIFRLPAEVRRGQVDPNFVIEGYEHVQEVSRRARARSSRCRTSAVGNGLRPGWPPAVITCSPSSNRCSRRSYSNGSRASVKPSDSRWSPSDRTCPASC